MNSDIERLARAAAEHSPSCTPWNQLRPQAQENWRQAMLAALRELRKPSKQMLKAACKAMSPDRRPTPYRVSVKRKHEIRFQAMIDSITEEPDEQV